MDTQLMDSVMNYVKPELLIVTVVLYFIGMGFKSSGAVKDKHIPLFLGAAGIALCAVYVFAVSKITSGQDVAMAAFTAITQGILVAGLSTYVNQILKQSKKQE